MISFWCGKTKVRILTEAQTPTPPNNSPTYAEGVHMIDGLTDDEMNSFLDEHPTIVPLFEINVLSVVEPYVTNPIDHKYSHEPDPTSMKELQQARDALDRELAIS